MRASMLGAGAVGAVAAPAAQARQQQVRFDIPAQDLAGALQVFARQAGVQILFPYALATGQRSKTLRGTMPAQRALEYLIADHGLMVASADAARITLGPALSGTRPQNTTRKPRPRPAPRSPLPAPAPPPAPAIAAPDIVVTGRGVSSPLDRTAYSYAVSAIDWTGNNHQGPIAVAELFRMVPGFWVEASGGEGSNNVRSRGIPTDGFTSIALTENGIPIQYDGGLGYLNTDQSFRFDETVAKVEVVRGGPASLFTPNAPGGVANVITRSGLRNPGGRIKVATGDRGYARFDAVYGQKIGGNWGLLAGGFYRRDGGRRRPGYLADSGGQARVALDYEDGDNSLSLDLRHLDDRVTFYLPVPLRLDSGGNVTAIRGFDPLRDSLSGPETLHLQIKGAQGPTDFDLTRGTRSSVTALTLRGTLSLGPGLALISGTRWRTSDILRNALFPIGTPMATADYLNSIRAVTLAAYPQATRVVLRYTDNGAPVSANANGNGLVLGANLLSVHVPLDEFVTDNRLTWQFNRGGRHNFAFGMTLAHYSYSFDRTMGTILIDVRDKARLIDAVALNAGGTVVGSYTDQGFQRYGSIFDRSAMAVDALALYAADEWQLSSRLRLDFGARWERSGIHGRAAGKTTVDLGNPAVLADNAVLTPSGAIIAIDRAYAAFGWSAGASLSVTREIGLFARYTDTFRLPSASEFNSNPERTDQGVVPIRMAELGLKYHRPNVSLFATGFYARFDRLPFTDFRFDTASNAYEERTAIAGSETLGVELEALLRPVPGFDLTVQATWQAPHYRNFSFTDLAGGVPVLRDYSGRQLIRVPRLAISATPAVTLFDGRLRAELSVAAFSLRYSDIANTQRLPAYAMLGFDATLRVRDRVNLWLHATNLTNTLGLTEGNPRSGSFETGSAIQTYFLARPEFARSIRMGLTVDI